jgi:hypothetical protein
LGLKPAATLFVSVDISGLARFLEEELNNATAIADALSIAAKIYTTSRTQEETTRWRYLQNEGANPLRLLWKNSTGPNLLSTRLLTGLAAPLTVLCLSGAEINTLLQQQFCFSSLWKTSRDLSQDVAREEPTAVADLLQEKQLVHHRESWVNLLEVLAKKTASLVSRGDLLVLSKG